MEDSRLKAYRDELMTLADKSQDTFEKQLSYISSSAIGASMFLVDKLFKDFPVTSGKWVVIVGWILLAFTLLSNLISHLISSKFHYTTVDEIDCSKYDQGKAQDRNRWIRRINWCSTFLLVAGIAAIIIFISINMYHGKGN